MADYPNRTDLQNAATRQANFTGQTYGQATAQRQAQQAMPTGPAPTDAVPRPRPGAQALTRPTERPSEPITAGANFGAGPNAAQAGIRPRIIPDDPVGDQLRILYEMFPNDGLRLLLSKYWDINVG